MSDNEVRSRLYTAVLNLPLDNPSFIPKFENLKLFVTYYAYILHDRDTKLDENNNVISKTIHYHLVLKFPQPKRFNSVLCNLSILLGLPLECISLRSFDNLSIALNYLIHKSDKNKFQYSIEDIFTNSKSWLMSNFSISGDDISNFIVSSILNSEGDYVYLINTIGLDNCDKYDKIIRGIYKSKGW